MTDFCVSFKIVSCLLLNGEETWLGWVGLGSVGLGSVGLGWDRLGWVRLGWVGIGWVGLGSVGLGWVRFGSVRKKDDSTHGKLTLTTGAPRGELLQVFCPLTTPVIFYDVIIYETKLKKDKS